MPRGLSGAMAQKKVAAATAALAQEMKLAQFNGVVENPDRLHDMIRCLHGARSVMRNPRRQPLAQLRRYQEEKTCLTPAGVAEKNNVFENRL